MPERYLWIADVDPQTVDVDGQGEPIRRADGHLPEACRQVIDGHHLQIAVGCVLDDPAKLGTLDGERRLSASSGGDGVIGFPCCLDTDPTVIDMHVPKLY